MYKNDGYYIEKVLNDIDFIIEHMTGLTIESFSENAVLQDSMMFRLIQISENARNVSDAYKEKHTDVPWFEINGLRNRIVHNYGNVDLQIVYDTLAVSIPELKQSLSDSLRMEY